MTKYRAIKTTVDNIVFASKREAARYTELKMLFRAGKIRNLELQPKFILHAYGGEVVGKYIADFAYFEGESRIIEDVKGVRTPLYRRNKRHVEAEYKVKIRET